MVRIQIQANRWTWEHEVEGDELFADDGTLSGSDRLVELLDACYRETRAALTAAVDVRGIEK